MTFFHKIKSLFPITDIKSMIPYIILFVIIDLTSKYIAFKAKFNEYYITSFLNISKVKNYGISFGLLSDYHDTSIYFIVILNIFIIIYLLSCLKTKDKYKNSLFLTFAICLIISGAIGNLFDRFYYGYVRDFIDFHLNNHHWPCFNAADIYICIGSGMLLYTEFFLKKCK